MNNLQKIILLLVMFLFLGSAQSALARQARIIYYTGSDIKIKNPEVSQIFYDKIKGKSRNYFINSNKDFNLYINLLVPDPVNASGKYSANVFLLNNGEEQLVAFIDGNLVEWQELYDSLGRDYYLKGPEFEKKVTAGNYKITVFSERNWGEYVLAIGKEDTFNFLGIASAYWKIPLLKIDFFKTSVWQFFLTPFGIAGLIAFFILIIIISSDYSIVFLIREKIKNKEAKTVLLTSTGIQQMKEQIKKMLHKPVYDILVGFITTAAKREQDISFMERDLEAMKEIGFNVEKIDIEGKNQKELRKLLNNKDIIFVEGGNTFYLLKCMRASGFGKVVKELMKKGVVYFGVSAGSIVAGQTIETAVWKNIDKNKVGLKNLKGLQLVPFNIFVHYQPEHAELIKQNFKKSKYPLRVLTDGQALFLQGGNTMLFGEEEEIIFKKEKIKIKIALKIISIIAVILLISFWILALTSPKLFLPKKPIINFEDCAKAGYPILETYPEQCRTPDGKTFIKEIK
jgi:dipeptidase E